MTNDKIRRNIEIRMTKTPIALLRVARPSSFGFHSSFVIRHSSFDRLFEMGPVSRGARQPTGRTWLFLALLFLSSFGGRAFVVELNSSGNPLRWRLDPPDPDVQTNLVNPVSKAIRFYLASDGYSS